MGKMIDTVQAESCEVGIERSPRAHVGLQTLQVVTSQITLGIIFDHAWLSPL
jgi:hypothetical protein